MTNIFDGFEKLINEHGSANILRERLALAKDKYDALQKELSECQQENKSLLNQIKLLEEENQKIKNKLRESTSDGKLSEPEVKILLLLSSRNRALTPEIISSQLGLSLTKTEYYLERMRKKYVSAYDYCNGRPSEYILIQQGREYLIENNLIE